jgi:hypothetical protein
MRRLGRWGATTGLLIFSLALPTYGQEPDTYQALSRRGTVSAPKRTPPKSSLAIPVDDSWWPFGRSAAGRVQPQPMPGTGGTTAANTPPTPSSNKERAAALQKELDAYLRRMQVCDRLKEIADETGDAALEQQAELMAQRAWFIYQQRTAQLKLPGLAPLQEQATAEDLLSDAPRGARQTDQTPIRSVRAERTPTTPGGKPQP